MNLLFERLRLQGRIRDLIDRLGHAAALDIIHAALEREIPRETPATRLHTKIQQKSPDTQ
jgi:hypothetical protein